MFTTPASVQDRWHARLFFLKPLLRLSLAFIWLFTAACSLFFYPHDSSYELLANAGISSNWHPILLYGASIINALIGTGLLFGYQLMKLCIFQLLFISVYTLIISLALPYLWLEPFAPVAKNIPLVVAILVLMALESDR